MNKRIISLLCLLIIIIFVAIWGVSKSQEVMTGAQSVIRTELSNALGSTVTVGNVELTSYDTITIHNIMIYDKEAKPLFSSEKISVTYSPLVILRGQATVEAISHIEVQKPILNLSQTGDGRWNVQELFKQEDKESSSFAGRIRLVDGIGNISSAGSMWMLENLEGDVNFANKPTIDLKLQAVNKGAALLVEGSINRQKRSHLHIEASELSLADYQPFLPEGSLGLIGGSLKKLDVTVAENQAAIEWAGSADLVGIDIDIDGVPLRQVAGNMVFNNNGLYLFAHGTAWEQPIDVRGGVRINTVEPMLNLMVSSEHFDPRVIGKDVMIDGELAFEARITGLSTNPSIRGKVDLPIGNIAGYEIRNVNALVEMVNKKITVSQSNAEVFGGTVNAAGTFEFTDHSYQLQAKARGIDMAYMSDLLPGIQGRGNVNLEIKGAEKLAEADIQGSVSIGEGEVSGISFTSLGVGFYRHGDNIVIDYGRLNVAQGLVTTQGIIKQGDIELAVYGENLSLEQFYPHRSGMISGSGNFFGQIMGTLNQPEFKGHFTAANGRVLYQPFTQLKGDVQGSKERMVLDHMELIHGVTKHEMQGTIELSGQHNVNVTLRTHQARAEHLTELFMPGERLTGNVDNELALTGPIDDLNIEGKVLLTDGSFRGQLIAKAEGVYSRSQGVTTISQMRIDSLNTRVRLAGTISSQNELNFDITARNLNLQRLNLKLPYAASGRATFNGKLTGTLKSPAFNGQLSADKLTLNSQDVTNVNGQISFHDKEIQVPSVNFVQGRGMFNFSGSFDLEENEVYGNLTVENAQIHPMLAILNLPNKDIQGTVHGEMKVSGKLDNPNVWLNGTLQAGRIKEYPVESVKVDVALENNRLTIQELSAAQGAGVVIAKGTAELHGSIAMEIGGRDIDAGFVASFFNTTVKPEGKMGFTAQITGQTKSPHAAVSLEIDKGGIGSATFDSLYGLLLVEKDMVHVNQLFLKKGSYQASAYGLIPIAALNPIGRQQAAVIDQMDLKVRLDEADLSILPFLTKEVSWAEGQTHGEVNIAGTLAQPSITGAITVNNGTIKLVALANPIQKVGVDIRFEGDTISLKKFDGFLGKGSYSLVGTGKLQGLSLGSYDLSLVLNKPEIESKYFKGALDGNLQMTGKGDKPRITGELVFENNIINIPVLPNLEASNLDLGLDIGVTVGKKVRFYNPYLYDIVAEGHLRFAGSTREPNFSGQILASRGTVNYLRTQFKVNEASIDFKQFASFEPVIKLEAQTRLQQVLVSLNINGPIQAMQFSLTSEPAMRQQEILSLLTLRSSYADKQNTGNAGSIGRDEVFSILGAGLQMQFISGIEDKFQNALGLDGFKLVQDTTSTTVKKSYRNIETTTAVSQEVYNVEMSKYLTDKLLLTYTVGLDHEKSDLGLRYTLSKRTTLNASIDEKNRTWFGFETRFKF